MQIQRRRSCPLRQVEATHGHHSLLALIHRCLGFPVAKEEALRQSSRACTPWLLAALKHDVAFPLPVSASYATMFAAANDLCRNTSVTQSAEQKP